MPDTTLSDAIKEAYAVAPRGLVIYHTLELNHATFTEPLRVVRDNVDLNATLEDSAPHNAGEEVTFVGYAFDFTKPEVSSQGIPQMRIIIDNVSRHINAALEGALGSTDLVTVIYREFISTDLSGPQNDPPITMQIIDVTADVFRITATCGFPGLMNRKFPTEEYNAENSPGLVTA